MSERDDWQFERGRVLNEIEHVSKTVEGISRKVDETRNILHGKIESTRESLNDKIDDTHKELTREIATLTTRMAVQEVKSGIWGGLAGLITALALWAATKWGSH